MARRIEQVTRNVFYAVLQRRLPPELIREANVLVLEQDFIRRNLQLHYTLRDKEVSAAGGGKIRFVAVAAHFQYKMVNVGSVSKEYSLGMSIPNPIAPELKDFVEVTGIVMWRTGRREELNIIDAQRKFAADMKASKGAQVPFDWGKVLLSPGEDVEISLRYTLAKEEEDSELFQTKYASDSLKITIVDQGPTKRVLFARSVHDGDLESEIVSGEEQGLQQYRLGRYLLPHQGVVFWWKRAPAPVAALPAPAAPVGTAPVR